MVKAGKLPPVEERLPENPLVTTPVESVGKYGGTLYTATWWPEAGNVQLYFAVEAPIKWKADLTGYEPALVESYEWSADGKTFTMHMRKGMKWSDGEPYTSADWKFLWEDILKNPDQKIFTVPAYLRNTDGTPITMEFPDEYTVVWKSDKSLGVSAILHGAGLLGVRQDHDEAGALPEAVPSQVHRHRQVGGHGEGRQVVADAGLSLPLRLVQHVLSRKTAPATPSPATPTTGAWTPRATSCPTSMTLTSRSSPTSRSAC